MKTTLRSISLISLVLVSLLTRCGEKSKHDAKAVKEDVKELNKDVKQGAKDTNEEIKSTVITAWQEFKTSSEVAIDKTEKQLEVLTQKIASASKSEQEKLKTNVAKLKQQNEDLKETLAERNKAFKDGVISFNASAKENEQQFEREFNHDMNALGNAIKNLFKNNVN